MRGRFSATADSDLAAGPPRPFPMEVLFLTTLFSVLFAIFFLVLFLRSRQDGRSCSDQDALLPFRGDPPSATLSKQEPNRVSTDHDP